MERTEVNSDSEDEAFESADEGDMQNEDVGVRPNVDKISDSKNEEFKESVQRNTQEERDDTEDKNKVEEMNEKESTKKKMDDDDDDEDVVSKEGKDISDDGEEDTKQKQDVETHRTNSEEHENTEHPTEVNESENRDILKSDDTDVVFESSNNTDNNKDLKEKRNLKEESDKESDIKDDRKNSGAQFGGQSPIAQAMDRLMSNKTPETKTSSEEPAASGGWGWGGWRSAISKATTSVSSMLETVETQLGIPNPVEMAKLVTQGETNQEQSVEAETEKQKSKLGDEGATEDVPASIEENVAEDKIAKENKPESSDNHSNDSGSGLGSWFSTFGVTNISTMVQNTGKDFVSGSLDALEFVGKKTMDVISKGDPGLRHKRTTLSQAIREAKEHAENKENEEINQKDDKIVTFSIEFDKFQGLAHLEALEMISHESEAEIEKILLVSSEEVKKDQEHLFSIIREKFEDSLDVEESEQSKDVENFTEVINELISSLSLNVTATKLIASHDSTNSASLEKRTEPVKLKDIYVEAVKGFAEITARSVELFHKIGELMLLPDVKASFLVKNRSDSLRKLCEILKIYLTLLSTRYAAILNNQSDENSDDKAISKLITDVYLEASNSSTYIEDSYHLLIPIFQFTATR